MVIALLAVPVPPRPGPEGHVHGAVQRHGAIQLDTGRFSLIYLGIQRAQAALAVGLEPAHAEFLSQGEGLSVVIFSRLHLRGRATRGDLAEELQGICLVTPLLVLTGER
jgi:hypothetical protein